MRFTSAALFLAVSAIAPALACDMVPPPQVTNDFKEKIPGWLVWKFTPQAGFGGHMLTGHFNRRTFPSAAQEKAYLEKEIGRAAGALFNARPSRVALDGPSSPVAQEIQRFRTQARAFALTLDFKGHAVAAPGYMRINPNRKDIALIVAFVDPAYRAAANAIARNTMEHPGFDCTPGDSP
jgi:hypothetical protein